MRKIVAGLFIGAVLSCTAFAAEEGGVLPVTMDKYKKAREKVEALSGTTAAKLAPEAVEAAGKSIRAAQAGLKSGSDKATRESVEMALLQVTLADALADERATAEKTVAARDNLEKLEQRLAAILAGKGGE
jgi:hypothetical protein